MARREQKARRGEERATRRKAKMQFGQSARVRKKPCRRFPYQIPLALCFSFLGCRRGHCARSADQANETDDYETAQEEREMADGGVLRRRKRMTMRLVEGERSRTSIPKPPPSPSSFSSASCA